MAPKRIRAGAGFFLAFLFISVSGFRAAPGNDPFEAQMLEEVNQLRSSGCRCGTRFYPPVPPLEWNARLAKAAQVHARDMNTNQRMTHAGSDGSNAGQRARRAGYAWWIVGENIAYGYSDIKSVVEGWQESPDHCVNMMAKAYKHLGAARNGDYWVQDFAAPQ